MWSSQVCVVLCICDFGGECAVVAGAREFPHLHDRICGDGSVEAEMEMRAGSAQAALWLAKASPQERNRGPQVRRKLQKRAMGRSCDTAEAGKWPEVREGLGSVLKTRVSYFSSF